MSSVGGSQKDGFQWKIHLYMDDLWFLYSGKLHIVRAPAISRAHQHVQPISKPGMSQGALPCQDIAASVTAPW